jgi:hypothetical protein
MEFDAIDTKVTKEEICSVTVIAAPEPQSIAQ